MVISLPSRLLPGTDASFILIITYQPSLLLTCPYHFSLFRVIFFVTDATSLIIFIAGLICLRDSPHPPHHSRLIDLRTRPVLALPCCPRQSTIIYRNCINIVRWVINKSGPILTAVVLFPSGRYISLECPFKKVCRH